MQRYIAIAFIFTWLQLNCFAQNPNNSNQLALHYYTQGDYEKAADYFERIFSENHTQSDYNYLVDCYLKTEQFAKAEKITKQQLKNSPKSSLYLAKLVQIFQLAKQPEEAQNIEEKLIKLSQKNGENYCLKAGSDCQSLRLDSLATVILEKGLTTFENKINFSNELSKIYLRNQNYRKYVQTSFSLLDQSPNKIEQIEENLQIPLYEEANSELKNVLSHAIDSTLQASKKLIYKDFAYWFFVQEKNFERAYSLRTEIDAAKKDNSGDEMFELGRIALNNKNYVFANKCFSNIVQRGQQNDWYEAALNRLLETSFEELFRKKQNFKLAEAQNLEAEYKKAFAIIQDSKQKIGVIKNLAFIQAYYLDNVQSASELLQQTINDSEFRKYKSELQLLLADIQLYTNDIWTANMQYAAIALAYKNTDIGNQAQLQQAKVAYYSGNITYAQTLLDVLKGSTNKLIANDAFELSQLINDYTALDTTTAPMEMFARGDLLVYQNKFSEAIACYDSITQIFKGHSLEDNILWRKSTIAESLGDTAQMIQYLTEIEGRFSYEINTDKAIFKLAELGEQQGNTATAMEKYKKILTDYQNSIFSNIARNRYRYLKQICP